ncbi:ADP-ribosylglycohydrolase family protein [Puerhibacterium sp. TATVAM-FAB25]|uniref:ADP-ribosylglycohydrolase family protein n=1 Tax=Puerhibacterium sp. TATVAM-FAB25 TaxID=3093699 RepID=UPI00397BFE2B
MYELDLTSALFRDKVRGCWVGKNCGGTLGTPLEEAWGRPEPFDVWWYPELREGGLPNDDLEMQLVWLTALEQVGPRLRARDLARYWLDHIGYNFDEYGLSKTNLRLGLEPPVSGAFNNWFVDCMGSPIRSEIWACVAPGAPRLAARLAYEDAICDHAGGESVYGELFNVAVQSSAFVVDDRRTLIDIGLSYVPADSRTAVAVRAALEAIDRGADWKTARAAVLEATPHHVAQYSPVNLAFQVIGLLDGDGFGDAMCKTVNCGYDTDSSGGTIGSWWGILSGASGLDARWTAPFGESISTNEDWGGVRHMTDGSTPIPRDLPQVVDRVVAAARRVLGEEGLLTGHTRTVEIEDLYADEEVRSLWRRDPLLVEHPGAQVGLAISYAPSPAVSPRQRRPLEVRVDNPHPDAVEVRLDVMVPAGWTAVEPQTVHVPPAESAEVTLDIDVPGPELLENTNTLYLAAVAKGLPVPAAVPVVLIGAAAWQFSGPWAEGDATSHDAAELLDQPLDPEKGVEVDWHDVSAIGNAVPTEALPAGSGVHYLRTWLQAPEPMQITVGVESSHPVAAWLNGVELIREARYRPIRPAYRGSKDGSAIVQLDEGWNEILVKVARGADEPGDAGFPQLHLLLSSADRLANGVTDVGRTRIAPPVQR